MKKEEIKKLLEVVKKIVQKEVSLAIEDIGKTMGKIIKEQVSKEMNKQVEILKEHDIIGRLKNKPNNVRDDFNNNVNYGYVLAQAANSINNSAVRYNPKPTVDTGNKILNEVFMDVAKDMPDDFGNEYFGLGNPLMTNNTIKFTTDNVPQSKMEGLNLNMNSYGNQIRQPIQVQPQPQPINFELPGVDPDNKPIHLDSVPDNIINAMVKNYRPTIQNIEKIKKGEGNNMARSVMMNRGLDNNFNNYTDNYIPEV